MASKMAAIFHFYHMMTEILKVEIYILILIEGFWRPRALGQNLEIAHNKLNFSG